MKIGLLSDTHSYIHPGVLDFLSGCDEIWHCGDFGSLDVADRLSEIAPLRGVCGNIDGREISQTFPLFLDFECAGIKVVMIHIGGYPGKYDFSARTLIEEEKPGLFVCGHSHILKVMYDKQNKLMYMNPGAAGKFGIHTHITAIRFDILNEKPQNLEVFDVKKSG